MAFGIMTLLMGVLAGLFIPLMLFGQVMAAKTAKGPTNFTMILPAIAVYGTMAVALVWLGIGSIMARRWARALLLICSWSWLVMGVIVMAGMAFVVPKIMAGMPSPGTDSQPASHSGSMTAVITIAFVFNGVVFIVLPAIWTYFYRSPHVKATCEARDPVARWTDACPLPVLGLCLWLLFSVPMLFIMPVSGHCVMPFFGVYLTGLPAVLLCLTAAALWVYAAWRLYRLDSRGWWLVLVLMGVFIVSNLLTFARHDAMEMYQLMGTPEAQIEQLQKTGLLVGNRMNWLMWLSVLPFLGYLLFIKKYFRSNL